MIGAALLIAVQAVSTNIGSPASIPAAAPTPPAAVPQRVPIGAEEAVSLFRSLCLPNVGDDVAFAAAMASSPLPFTSEPRRGTGPGQTWRADRALLTYGPARDGSRHCTLLGRAADSIDQLRFSAGVASALTLKTGRTRTGKGQAVTDWTVAGSDGRPVRISAATRNAATGGGTDIRLSAAVGQ